MQTFLPYADFAASARALDRMRLNKQRLEAKQIAEALLGRSHGWTAHPATRAWAGHIGALAEYGMAICQEWRARGYKDTLLDYFCELLCDHYETAEPPPWTRDSRVHDMHRAHLIRKRPEWYAGLWPGQEDVAYDWALQAL